MGLSTLYYGQGIASSTATASIGIGPADLSRVLRVRGPQARFVLSSVTSAPKEDPEKTLLSRIKDAEQRQMRAAARARIELKRAGHPVDALLKMRDLPENRIVISKEALADILSSFPGDEE